MHPAEASQSPPLQDWINGPTHVTENWHIPSTLTARLKHFKKKKKKNVQIPTRQKYEVPNVQGMCYGFKEKMQHRPVNEEYPQSRTLSEVGPGMSEVCACPVCVCAWKAWSVCDLPLRFLALLGHLKAARCTIQHFWKLFIYRHMHVFHISHIRLRRKILLKPKKKKKKVSLEDIGMPKTLINTDY